MHFSSSNNYNNTICESSTNIGAGVASPLHEKEKFLESSHRALKEKLAKVREEILQLSEMPSSDCEGQSSVQVTTTQEEKSNFSAETR